MTPRAAGAHRALAVALTVCLGVAPGCRKAATPDGPAELPAELVPGDPQMATIFFAGPGNRLVPEQREIGEADSIEARIALIVGALLEGPQTEGLAATLPAGVELGPVVLTEEGLLYIDLEARDRPHPPPSGSTAELLAVYSLVNTVLLNVPQARRVVLLWNGSQRPTFAGHLDTSRPLIANRDLVAGQP